jgi:hypothetical protein
MNAFRLIWGEGPLLGNEIAPRLAPRGDEKGLSRLAFDRNDTTLTSWAAYAARRRLRNNYSGGCRRWRREVVR